MSWITLKEAAELTQRPERTLRLYAAQGKIRVKKAGKFWLCDPTSFKEAGIVLPNTQSPVTTPPSELAAPSPVSNPVLTFQPPPSCYQETRS